MPSAMDKAFAQIDKAPYPRRRSLLATLAKELGPLLPSTVDGLYQGTRFDREAAVFMAMVTRCEPVITAARTDPDEWIRAAALNAWLRLEPPATAIADFMMDAPWAARRRVYRELRARVADPAVDDIVDRIRDRFGDEEAARLLPAATEATVARLLPELGHALENWSLLGKRYPDAVLDEAARQLAALSGPTRAAWWHRYGNGLWAAIDRRPRRGIELLERFAPPDSLPGRLRSYGPLLATDPEAVVAMLAVPGRTRWLTRVGLPDNLVRRMSRLPVATLAPLARRLRDNERQLVTLLAKMPPSHRSDLYDVAYAGVDRAQAILTDEMLMALPRERRATEARRILALHQIRDDSTLVLHYTSFLPWPDATGALTAATRRAAADDRATAYELLVLCAARSADPAIVVEVMEQLLRIRNEQDPVRGRVLTAVAANTVALLTPDALPALEQLAADALAARDAGGGTRGALHTLAVSVLRHHAATPAMTAWSLRTLQRIFGDQIPWLGQLDTQLMRGQEAAFFDAVREWLANGAARGHYQALFAVVRGLRRRAHQLPDLQDMLRAAMAKGNISSVVRQAIELWLEPPATRSDRVEQVLRVDRSAIALPPVWHVVASRRTDLLDLVIGAAAPRGRFIAGGVRWVPPDARYAIRWLPRQQRAYVELVAAIAADAGAKMAVRTHAIACAARVPELGWGVVHRWLDSPSVNLAEAALGALAWTDRPADALPILLAHMGDDRARVAVYAAGRTVRYLRPSRLAPLLTGDIMAAGSKVTSRKEAVRLAASQAVPGVGDFLLATFRAEGQHRDVRAAVVSAARQRLHDPPSWTVLGEAVAGGPEDLRAIVGAPAPLAVAAQYRVRYASLVVTASASAGKDIARLAWQALPAWTPWLADLAPAIVARLTDLDDRTVWRATLPALMASLDSQPAALAAAVQALVRLDIAGNDTNDPGRDQPARQRLAAVVAAATQWSMRADIAGDRTALLTAGRMLAERADFAQEAATLVLYGSSLASGADFDAVVEASQLLVAQPVAAFELATALSRSMLFFTLPDDDGVYATAKRLAADGSASAGMFALSLAERGRLLGWTAPWRSLIHQLRAHPEADVRAVARQIYFAIE